MSGIYDESSFARPAGGKPGGDVIQIGAGADRNDDVVGSEDEPVG